jgi:hypothetical protein
MAVNTRAAQPAALEEAVESFLGRLRADMRAFARRRFRWLKLNRRKLLNGWKLPRRQWLLKKVVNKVNE